MVSLLSICSKRPSREASCAAASTADLILEIIQGPCTKNQEKFAMNTELIEIMNRMLRSPPSGDMDPEEDDELKKCLLEIFEGLTEGQVKSGGQGSVVFDRILSVIDLDVLQVLIMAQGGAEDELSEIQIEGLVLLQMFCDYDPKLWEDITLPKRIRTQMTEAVQSVEVVWNGKLQRRFFPVPEISEHIAEATRQKLVAEVERTNGHDAKLQDFLTRIWDIYGEFQHQQWLSEQVFMPRLNGGDGLFNLAQLFSRTNQDRMTTYAFICACVINIIFLFTFRHNHEWYSVVADIADSGEDGVYSDTKTWKSAKLGQKNSDFRYGQFPFGRLFSNSNGTQSALDDDAYVEWEPATPIIRTLNILNILFSSFTLLLSCIVRCPVKYKKLRAHGMSETKALAYTVTDGMTMYYCVYTVLAIVSMAVSNTFHPFLLLDIIVKDSTTADVINAVVYPRKQLKSTLVLTVFVIYIFAMILFKNYSGDFGDMQDCRSLYHCFLYSLNYGMRLSGGVGDLMSHTLSFDRVVVDLLYFMIVLVILLNIVFGIIIDTFSDLRNKKLERLHDTTEICFICGKDRLEFDSKSIEPGAFYNHIHNDHYMWNYVNFIFFIWQQDRDDDDGLELFVRKLVEHNDITWLPSGQALVIQDLDGDSEEPLAEQLARLEKDVMEMIQTVNAEQAVAAATSNNLIEKVIGQCDSIAHMNQHQMNMANNASKSRVNKAALMADDPAVENRPRTAMN